MSSVVGARGQVVIEKLAREALGIGPGHISVQKVVGDHLEIRQADAADADSQQLDKNSTPLRDGTVDFETGVIGRTSRPEVRAQTLFRDRFVGVVRVDPVRLRQPR